MRALSLDQIEAARQLLISNARELVNESNLLIKEGRYARSYALAHIACEELSKIPMLVRAGTWVALGLPVDWKKLDKRLRNHQGKLRQVEVLRYAFDLSGVGDDNFVAKLEKGVASLTAMLDHTSNQGMSRESEARLMKGLSRVPGLNKLKNLSLYVSYEEQGNRFIQPTDAIRRDLADAMHQDALGQLAFYEKAEATTQGMLRRIRIDPALRKSLEKKCKPLARRLSRVHWRGEF